MKKIIFLLVLSLTTPCLAAEVTQLVFGQASSAKTSTENVRVTVMTRLLRKDDNIIPIQGFALQAGSTYNYFLTKSTTFPVTADFIAVQIEVDQDTTLKVNSETTSKKILAGERVTYVLK